REVNMAREPFLENEDWLAEPIMVEDFVGSAPRPIHNPANPHELVGHVTEATVEDCVAAIEAATLWEHSGSLERAFVLRRAADLYETNFGELFALLTREAGKTPVDAVAEVREAVDFLRYYANQAEADISSEPRGLITCISPWNFPLAIFTGQIAAALAAGNGVLAKPAETTPIIAAAAVRLIHSAGVPRSTLQLLPGDGSIGGELVKHEAIRGVCFTGSTATAQKINRTMAEHLAPSAPLIAETGGLNAAIIDSTALPEQAVRDTLASAFQSAGQRCSALRILYLQADVAEPFLEMVEGAMEELEVGNPWHLATDVGPIISAEARDNIQSYVDAAKAEGRLIKQLPTPENGNFVGPAIIEVDGIQDLEREIFGPVLHVAKFAAKDFDKVIEDINNSGFGLTFGLHTRIDERAKTISEQMRVGNVYVNRNQVGAIVESQPFGGEGLSGTGPKAGGPHYVHRFYEPPATESEVEAGEIVSLQQAQSAANDLYWQPEILSEQEMPCVTGESNKLALWPKGTVLCLGPTVDDAIAQAGAARRMGCPALIIVLGAQGASAIDGYLDRSDLTNLEGIEVVALWSHAEDQRAARKALAAREGKIVPLVTARDLESYCVLERHTCIDTTAAGGNASLLAATEDT
ncbi:MAG: L-glutamate gamma-semialdehyde dehydrogenase, partial [Pseudomonadales bacterium]